MVTSKDCFKKYGDPTLLATQQKWLVVWDVPSEIEIGFIPKKLYCNKDLIVPLETAFRALIAEGIVDEIHSWDGCWNIRKKRGQTSMSLHSWAIAIDLNAATNCFGCKPTLSAKFVKCFTDVGFDWGGTWSKPDGMHFQLSKI